MSEKKPTPKKSSLVHFVQDPFQIPTLEISEAQRKEDELDLDQDLEGLPEEISEEINEEIPTEAEAKAETRAASQTGELENSPEFLESIARALDTSQQIEAHATPSEEPAFDSAVELARQIAEDVELEKVLALENSEQEKAEKLNPELLATLPKEPIRDANGELDLSEMQSCLEAILFMSEKPLGLAKLQELLGPDFSTHVFQEALTLLMDRYQNPSFGIELVQVGGGYQLRTKPSRAALAKKLARIQLQRLSTGAMETLAITAYKQPVMKEDIDQVRGVDSSHFIRGLMERKLIEITGRSELPGRPMVYATTSHFLELFGLKDLSAMPSLRELESMIPSSQSGQKLHPDEEDPRVKEMRKLVGQMKADHQGALKYDPAEDEKILKEISLKVGSIGISTPYLEEQKALEKQAKLAQTLAEEAPSLLPPSEA